MFWIEKHPNSRLLFSMENCASSLEFLSSNYHGFRRILSPKEVLLMGFGLVCILSVSVRSYNDHVCLETRVESIPLKIPLHRFQMTFPWNVHHGSAHYLPTPSAQTTCHESLGVHQVSSSSCSSICAIKFDTMAECWVHLHYHLHISVPPWSKFQTGVISVLEVLIPPDDWFVITSLKTCGDFTPICWTSRTISLVGCPGCISYLHFFRFGSFILLSVTEVWCWSVLMNHIRFLLSCCFLIVFFQASCLLWV